MRFFVPGAACALRAVTLLPLLLLLLGLAGNAFAEVNITSTTSNPTPHPMVQGTPTSASHPTSTSHPTTTPASSTIPAQSTEAKRTGSTTASSVTSSQVSVTVTTSKISSTSVTATSKSETVVAKASRFDVGSFVGGIVLTLCVLVILYVGCKTYHSRRGIQYRTIDEHDAII
ncbi:hypothetical protein ASZ78_016442 [Callipepla squamata]|uniref:Transmembrane protein 123 n=1 Tax=Callipepla squamata TaxID=9009 RepID=A0A226MRH5_CALSU|nr:hypothetical protein ASZ78_016442 [Callipepla squamata]